MKTILAEHDGIHARIVEERSDIGWTLHILLPTGRSKDHLQDTKDIALSQAEDDYHIPRESWRDGEIIYIRLLNEGTDVWRPVDSLPVGDGLYRIAPASWPLTDEIWEFQPGSVVQCAEKQLSTGTHLVATKSIGTKETEQGGDGDAEEAV